MKLSNILLTMCLVSIPVFAENIVFPDDAGLIDVSEPPYNMVGDGVTDNTAALRQAFSDHRGTNRTLYFPNGVYLLSDRVNISGDEPSQAHSPDRFLHLQGQSQAGVVIKLKENSPGYDDPANPKTFISLYEGQSTGDVMHSYVRNLTIEIGPGNPGAAALRYISNNSGAMYDVTIRSSDPAKAGAIGLDLRQSQQGPALMKQITVDGFDRGIEVGNSFSMVFEHITLRNQREAGFVNNNARTTIRGLNSSNTVPALTNGQHGNLTLIEANLTGGAASESAIVTGSTRIFLRDITAAGYGHTVQTSNGAHIDGDIDEWYDGLGHSLFGCEMKTLRLPIEETPEIPWEEDVSQWVKVDHGMNQLQVAINQAAQAGKTTVYLPKLADKKLEYVVSNPVRVHGSVNRIIGMENILRVNGEVGSLTDNSVVFTFEDLEGPVVIERFFNILEHGGWKGLYNMYLFENKSSFPVIIRNLAHGACLHKKPSPGKRWFIEDMAGGRMALFGQDEKVWMRQYNPESPELNMCEIEGGQAWILGLKTEGRTRHIVATEGAKVEVLGGVSYQSWKNVALDPPMFTVVDSDASFTIGFYHWNMPFTTIVQETRDGETRSLPRTDLEYYHLPIYRACGRDKVISDITVTPADQLILSVSDRFQLDAQISADDVTSYQWEVLDPDAVFRDHISFFPGSDVEDVEVIFNRSVLGPLLRTPAYQSRRIPVRLRVVTPDRTDEMTIQLEARDPDCAVATLEHGLELDFNRDCLVNIADFLEMAHDWLICYDPLSTNPDCINPYAAAQ